MSTTTTVPGTVEPIKGLSTASVRPYFASDSRRVLQTALGLVWLLDGGLQFQSFMYGKGFIQMLTSMAAGQPGWLHDSVLWGAHTLQSNQGVWNTLFALTQVVIGLGLLIRPTVKPALALSFLWVLVVWWFGEAFGMLFMTMASPLTGAPGAVFLYAVIGAIAWPGVRPGGLLGVRGARLAWGALWVVMAWLWLETPSSSANAVSGAIKAAPSGMSWLSTVQDWATTATKGDGLPIALVLAALSLAIGIAVAVNWRPRLFLGLAVALNLAYWVFGQGLGGIFQGGATDPNAGLLFVVLAYALYTLIPYPPHPGSARPERQNRRLVTSEEASS
ncbi:MAG TPA: hypothetical protein VMD09_14880 [Solirubrobacteraceae bacterium]|nr:hypothetical protein [Solirubrobacteraceae bacterium]